MSEIITIALPLFKTGNMVFMLMLSFEEKKCAISFLVFFSVFLFVYCLLSTSVSLPYVTENKDYHQKRKHRRTFTWTILYLYCVKCRSRRKEN